MCFVAGAEPFFPYENLDVEILWHVLLKNTWKLKKKTVILRNFCEKIMKYFKKRSSSPAQNNISSRLQDFLCQNDITVWLVGDCWLQSWVFRNKIYIIVCLQAMVKKKFKRFLHVLMIKKCSVYTTKMSQEKVCGNSRMICSLHWLEFGNTFIKILLETSLDMWKYFYTLLTKSKSSVIQLVFLFEERYYWKASATMCHKKVPFL